MERLKFNSQAEFAAEIIQHGALRDTQGNVYSFENESAYPYKFMLPNANAKIEVLSLGWMNWKSETFEIVKEAIPDKAPVWAWDEGETHRRYSGFYDSIYNGLYTWNGRRDGAEFCNFEIIPSHQIPEWMKEAAKSLED
jgi:hypothetical protein